MTAAVHLDVRPRAAASAPPVLEAHGSLEEITDELASKVFEPPRWMRPALLFTFLGTLGLFAAVTYTVVTGIGVWGNNIPNTWAFAITNFVWWIGIGHAGTFISAFLLLLEQKWRASINRFAEAMTLIALIQAATFPLLHLGRPWFAYWLVPYPSTMAVWPQFRSALVWDMVAVSTYFTVSLLFWYLGLVPDFATLRDRAPTRSKRIAYAILALGWKGTASNWHRWRIGYGLLAGLATPLVVSVHSVIASDFAIAQLPGWHSTIFPPYFVAGAIYSGFAMVVTLLVPVRRLYRLEHVVTQRHLDNIGKMLLVMGWIVLYCYVIEEFSAWYSGDPYEQYTQNVFRPTGTYAWIFWIVIGCNCGPMQLLFSARARRSPLFLWIVSALIQIGMWTERFMLIVTSETRDFLPSSWRPYRPTLVDAALVFGTISFFAFLFLLFLRFVPFIPISEIKALRHELDQEGSDA